MGGGGGAGEGVAEGGGGGSGGVGGEGGWVGGPAGRGFNCLWSWRTVRLRTPVSQGGYPFEAKKRGPKKGGVPVLTT